MLNETAFSYDERLKRVKEHVQRHIDESMRLEQAAKIACLEKKYFSAYFRKKAGIPYSEWLHLIKIEEAAKLLMNKDFGILEISQNLGYESVSTFGRRFKRLKKQTPMEFKKAIQKKIYNL